MNLVIVESPAKAKTIQKYLGHGYVVKSSYGHVRDLPKTKLGVDTDNNFEPHYMVPAKAKENLKTLEAAAKKADIIYFATDEDREGEAIAWHLIEALKPPAKKIRRITFTEITKSAILKAVENPREIDQSLVNAQQARRVLDRLVGYKLSPLLWKKVRRGLSAGRVQSVAVRLIVEREDEINKFTPEEYWSLLAHLKKNTDPVIAELALKADKPITKLGVKTKEEMDGILRDLQGVDYVVKNLETKERKRTPPPPFTTSTLQQAAVNLLGYSSKKTMMLAQQMYEGVELGDEGPTGLITYMRTDSVSIGQEALTSTKEAIKQQFGGKYVIDEPRTFTNKSKGAQEAHEAIRPTDPTRTPESLSSHLDAGQLKLYQLIWRRVVASQMAEARVNQTVADIEAGNYTFKARGSVVVFDGFVKALGEKAALKETVLPELKVGDKLDFEKLEPEQHFTQPPARYSEATLVKTLEEAGIGRPSTYAPTIDVIQRREYVIKGDDKRFSPTEVGTLVNGVLTQHFPNIVDINFTAGMESDLDEVAAGKKKWQPLMKEFYEPFEKLLKVKEGELSKAELTQEKTGETCPKCDGEVVIKLGRFGKFKACTKYPECKFTEAIGEEKALQQEMSDEKCPDCGKPLVVKRGRFGPFLGCSGYPECKHIKKIEKETGVNCPKCVEGKIIEKRTRKGKPFFACNRYPDCQNAYWTKPTGEKCPDCGSLLVFGAKNTIKCSNNKECKFKKDAPATE
ncbi:MAG: type I DNA topoisomerase [Candidatus Andersenbacteria bacterium]|nr:type I DNA topoisomerase [Candidatus Andersenbacteria bacterium]